MDEPWIVQWYAKVPALGNVADAVPVARSGMFAGEPWVSNVTLWFAANVHVTTPLRVTVTLAGLNVLLAVASTAAVAPGTVTVTLTVAVFVTEPTVPLAVMVVVPTATPVITPAFVTVAMAWLPELYVVVRPLIVPPF
jgi:hypothetical protein